MLLARHSLIRCFTTKQSIGFKQAQRIMFKRKSWFAHLCILAGCGVAPVLGSEADIKIPDLAPVACSGLGGVGGQTLMYLGIPLCAAGAIVGVAQPMQTHAVPV